VDDRKLNSSVRGRRIATNALLATLYAFFALTNIMQWRSTHRPVGLGIMLLELVAAVLFMVRRDPWSTSRAPLAWVATAIGSWGMLLARPAYAPAFGTEALYIALQLVGAVAAACALGVLGRSFGLVAANRGIRTAGPYGIVRHPVYASYVLADLGYVLENPSLRNAIVFAAVTTFQIVRIGTEESCLRADDAYVRYCTRVPYRLVPGVW
jgi:protein-S-isoprenylcysteine O-methyltransferase Ste14